jgi:hypothetical protein
LVLAAHLVPLQDRMYDQVQDKLLGYDQDVLVQ